MKIKLSKKSKQWVDLVKDIYHMTDSQAIEMAIHKCTTELTDEYVKRYIQTAVLVEEPKPEPKPKPVKYLLGQRVIVHNNAIGTVVKSETKVTTGIWVYIQSRRSASNYSPDSVKPLPNGQL